MAEDWDETGPWRSASRVPVNEWFPVNTATGEWQLPGQPLTLARSAGLPDVNAPAVMGGMPDQAPLSIGQASGGFAPALGPQPRLAQVARASAQGLLPEQPTMWGSLARSLAFASPTGKSILQGFDQQQQQQLQNRLTLRRQQLLEEQETRQATQTSLETLRKISEMPNKTMRNLMFDRYVADMQSSGQQLPTDMVEAFKKSSLDEGKQMAQMLTPMFEAAGIDPAAAQQILQEGGDPKRLMEMLDLGLKVKKQKADEAEEARLLQSRQTLFGASTGAGAPPTTEPTAAPPPPTTAPARATPTPPGPTARPGTVPPVLDTAVTEATKLYPQVRPDLVHGIIRHESNYDVGAVSPKGAVGPMQLMPDTATDMGVDPKDPAQNVRGGVRYYAQLLTKYNGNEALALAAYNWGPGNVDKVGGDLTKMPAETQAYVKNVLASAAPGGQRARADTRQQVAGSGAPAAAADQAQLTRLGQQIAAMDQFLAANIGSGRERTKGMVNEVQQERTRLMQEREKLTETQRLVERERQLGGVRTQESLERKRAEARADYESKREQQAGPMLPEDRRKLLTGLRSDIRQEPTFKIYQDVRNGYQNVQIGAKRDSSEGDLALIYGLAKILDPGSVVRESEFATVAAAQGKLQQLLNTPQRFFEGDRLTPANRQKLLSLAQNLAQEKLTTAQKELRAVYEPLAKEGNIAFDQLLPLGDLKSAEGQSLLEDMQRGK